MPAMRQSEMASEWCRALAIPLLFQFFLCLCSNASVFTDRIPSELQDLQVRLVATLIGLKVLGV